MKSTKQNFALKQLQKAVTGGTIITPDKAIENRQTSVLSETANIWVLRKEIVKAMVTGLAPAIADGTVKASHAPDLVASADALACELMRLEVAEVEEINNITGGTRSPGFEYLLDRLEVPRIAKEPAAQPTLVQAPVGA